MKRKRWNLSIRNPKKSRHKIRELGVEVLTKEKQKQILNDQENLREREYKTLSSSD
jgi:hypothetical protein